MMKLGNWIRYLTLIFVGLIAISETVYAWLKYQPVTAGQVHWFVAFYDKAKDYRSAYAAIVVFLLYLPSIPFFRKIHRVVTVTKKRDRSIVRFTQAEEIQEKRRLVRELISRYQEMLWTFEENRSALDITRPVTLRYKNYDKLRDFENEVGVANDHFIETDLTSQAVAVVVIGPPGMGKSYTLLRRIMDALEAVDQDDEQKLLALKIPYFFRLGNWSESPTLDTSGLLETWMEVQLKEEYSIESAQTIKWLLNNKHIIPILDGLDEVQELYRNSCLGAISKYFRLGLGRGVILSCRKEELSPMLISHRSGFGELSVCEILPMSREDIRNEIMVNVTEQEQADLFAYLELHDDLWEKINAPLILNLFEKTYTIIGGEGMDQLKDKPTDEFLEKLWSCYDGFIFKFKLGDKVSDYRVAKLRLYAVWIAKLNPDTSFYLDKIQPQWLDESVPQRNKLVTAFLRSVYFILSRTVSALMIAIGVGLIISEWDAFISNGMLAGCLVGLIAMLTKNADRDSSLIRKIYDITVLSFILMLVCGLFQAASVPRKVSDMHGIFATTESFPGILLGLFSGLIFGYRRNFQTYDYDIKPVERSNFDWLGALKKGSYGALGVGILIGFFGVLVRLVGQGSTFYQWLGEYNDHVLGQLAQISGADVFKHWFFSYLSVFLLAFFVAGLVGFVIIFILSGRDEEKIKETDISKKQKLNYGIYSSGIQGLIYGACSTLGIVATYGLILFLITGRYESIVRVFAIGLGIGMIAFLWFGGIEVVQHWTLRLLLFLYGVLPLRMIPWLKTMHQVSIIHRSGNNLHFPHPTLKAYTGKLIDASGALAGTQFSFIRIRRKTIILLSIGLIFIIAGSISATYNHRFRDKVYWEKDEELVFMQENMRPAATGNDHVVIGADGTYELSAAGSVLVGTFVGRVAAEGTFEGFLGVPIGDSYNIVKGFSHGALLFRSDLHYKSWNYVAERNGYFWPWTERKRVVKLSKGERITFLVNDNEYQNDSGEFRILIKLIK